LLSSDEVAMEDLKLPFAKNWRTKKELTLHVQGSGGQGRVVKRDIDYWIHRKCSSNGSKRRGDLSINKAGEYTTSDFSMRKVIAKTFVAK